LVIISIEVQMMPCAARTIQNGNISTHEEDFRERIVTMKAFASGTSGDSTGLSHCRTSF